jgi:hypothetical protein
VSLQTKAELVQRIDDELVWRRRELTDFKSLIQGQGTSHVRTPVLLRAGIVLLYAHWEGFVKCSGSYYLQFVADQRLKGSELTVNFLAIKLRTKLTEAKRSKKASASAELIEFFCTKMSTNLKLPHKGVVDTESNLSSKVLAEILWTLGLDGGCFETKSKLIDELLVDRRNHIAHGQSLTVGSTDYMQLHDDVIYMMDEFRTLVQNAAVTDQFLRQ